MKEGTGGFASVSAAFGPAGPIHLGNPGLKLSRQNTGHDFKIAKLHKRATLLAYRHLIKIAYLGAFNHRLKQGLPLAALSPRNAKRLNESRSSDRDKRSQASYWASLDA